MKRLGWMVLGFAICSSAIAGGSPLATLRLYNGAFLWVKVGQPPASSLKSFAKAKSIVIDVNVSIDVPLKKDASGNQWFSFIVADQGSDGKWNQTKGNGTLKLTGGRVKAGNYKVIVPAAGIPASVLAGKIQNLSVGPATSGITGRPTILINGIRGQ